MTGLVTHGHTRGRTTTPEFRTWLAMRQRCNYVHSAKYARYGGRGIKVCKRWESFENFLADMGPRPAEKTLDRYPDRNGNYEPSNCRWATALEQAANRSRTSFASNSRKTHCPSGHPYAGANLRIDDGGNRKCKTCEKLRARVVRAKRLALA